MLKANNLSIGYENLSLASGINAVAHPGEMICLLGQNGCGKSTLLRTLCGLQNALEGSVTIENKAIHELTGAEKAQLLALVLTERVSLENTRVQDVTAMGRYPYSSFLGGLTEQDKTVINEALERVGLLHKKDTFYNCLSDGEKQRVLIAKALAQETPLILLDEPTAHLDLPNRIRILLLLRELAHTQQKTVIISTHELDLALQLADTIWLMPAAHVGKGRDRNPLQIGTPQELVCSGVFAEAFADENFAFETVEGHLRVCLKR